MFAAAGPKANNILITVADKVQAIFYNDVSASNMCAYHKGEIGRSTYVTCTFVLRGQIVQVQNNRFQDLDIYFHLAEVEVFGF